MAFFEKCLLKWREPKLNMLTRKNFFVMLVLIVAVSFPFGFLKSGPGRFSVSTWLLALASMSAVLFGMLLFPLLPGMEIRLTDDAIVRRMPRRNQRSLYKEIDCCRFYRNCSHSKVGNAPVLKVHDQDAGKEKFTSFDVILKGEKMSGGGREVSFRSMGWVRRFAVPSGVDLDAVLKILREKNVNVIEPDLSSERENC
jgi:hypothetical protein